MVSSAVTEGEHMNYDSDNHYANWLNNKENALSISLKGSFILVVYCELSTTAKKL